MRSNSLSIVALAGLIALAGCSGSFSGSDPSSAGQMTVTHAQAICQASFSNTAIRAGHTEFFVSTAFLAEEQRVTNDEEYIVFGHVRGTSGRFWPVVAICAIDTSASVDETWMPNLGAVTNFHIIHYPSEPTHRDRLADGVFASIIQ